MEQDGGLPQPGESRQPPLPRWESQRGRPGYMDLVDAVAYNNEYGMKGLPRCWGPGLLDRRQRPTLVHSKDTASLLTTTNTLRASFFNKLRQALMKTLVDTAPTPLPLLIPPLAAPLAAMAAVNLADLMVLDDSDNDVQMLGADSLNQEPDACLRSRPG
ncbi:hypothetical protein PLESTF_000666800 [Pleodorina starrii]|nr:hypothetical protein PLESTM_001740300 [Pleodorina starrii]GLC68251.1 hypothetical protein PLESTF_000666800 [Pleodorina starrii]